VASEHPEAGARRIDEDAVKRLIESYRCGVSHPALEASKPEAPAIVLDEAQALAALFETHHLPLISHQLSRMGGLAPGGRAGVEHTLPWVRVKKIPTEDGGFVLDGKPALTIAPQLVQRWM
jgi:hypothetical protein